MVRLFIILTVIASLCICYFQPQMHKQIMVYDSGYKLVLPDDETKKASDNIEIPTVKQEEIAKVEPIVKVEEKAQDYNFKPIVNVQEQKNIEKPIVQVEKIQKNIPVPKVVQKVLPVQSPKVVTTKSEKTEIPKQVENIVNKYKTQPPIKQQEPIKQVQPVVQQKTVEKPVVVKKETPVVIPKYDPVKESAQKAKEEEIAWNKWRSRLQNQIMRDARMPNIPQGIIFKFSFTVDKYGKISNVQTWSTTPAYTPHAIQFIAPVIRSYQGHSILNFPAGSNRVTTEVYGAWKISTNSKYSTPQDYNDTEKVSR